ncbi:TetR family transcriptional regulator [Streptomyces alfalfae]|uniref:TetR family transcriptional regulator n=1 Tax=Streptomyces alfalfae TaxID=1642299 RepID=A0A1P8TTR1_9ACTN|nr:MULTISPECIES: TetR/AcrR family transcriptional regulator [Streptomyces]AYA21267.1 TetR/AcrR family transcriptional regulator [Streptomyces fradiae]APY91001.1 TetR family transcriptional regulator [Streptomyces alfalfae]KUL50041.1 TetR family transcriptional regulator [Streptomyces sp. NRRL S-1521]QQC93802.1 TetR/AcrR family transcriptional regulator [Streptomyces alfalfae]QUI35881.1 TetR/AcrR family transcriptional regulator [Streptomyces alfalfae]
MAEAATTRRSRITPEREAELYEAVLDLLREVGYDALTMDAVATRTRSSKATLYRQWGSKPELIARALRHSKPASLADIDTGSLRGDLNEMVARSDDCQMERDAALMRGLFHAVHDNPELHRALRDLLIEPELTGLSDLLRRAVERGEVAADNPALDYVVHMMVGGFVARDLVEDRPVDRAFLASYIDAVILPALGV